MAENDSPSLSLSNIGMIVSGSVALISIVIALNTGVRADIDVLRQSQTELLRDMSVLVQSLHQKENERSYHSGRIDNQVSALSKSILDLDTTLQREMRQLDDTSLAQFNAFDSRLQAEIKNTAGLLAATIHKLEGLVEQHGNTQSSNRERIARIEEQLRTVRIAITNNKVVTP